MQSRIGQVYLSAPVVIAAVIAAALATAAPSHSEPTKITPFAANVTTHVLAHELGHAVMREFAEVMADGFATLLLTQRTHDEAPAIVTDRVLSWMLEDAEVSPADYDMMGEHDLDIRRAYQAACLLYGADPAEFADDIAWIGFSQRDLDDCSDTAPDQIASWQRILAPHVMDGAASQNVEVIYGDGPLAEAMKASGVVETIADIARGFDWPAPIIIHFDHCGGGASWSRSQKRILLCDSYVLRFVAQGTQLSNHNPFIN